MTISTNGFHPQNFRLGITGPAKDEYRQIGIDAVHAGLGLDVARAMKAIVTQLRTNPKSALAD